MILSGCRVLKRILAAGYSTKSSVGRIRRIPRVDLAARSTASTRIDAQTIDQLERVSLVDFGNEEGIRIVEDAIRFADTLESVDTEGVQPLYTVLEDCTIPWREDEVTDGNRFDDVLSNAAVTEEGYFVVPPGNIPIETREYNQQGGQKEQMISPQLASSNIGLTRALKHFEQHGIVSLVEAKKRATTLKKKKKDEQESKPKLRVVEGIKFGPTGQLVLENMKREWFRTQVHFRDENVFVYNSKGTREDIVEDIRDSFGFAKEVSGGLVPFGFAEVKEVFAERTTTTSTKKPKVAEKDSPENEQPQDVNPEQEKVEWRLRKYTRLRYLAVAGPDLAKQFFYSWLHARKRWWRMFSIEPSRFSFADPVGVEEVPENGIEEVKIMANFDWGPHYVETARYHGASPFRTLDIPSQNLFSIRANGKRCTPHIVEFSSNLELGAFTYIADSLKDRKPSRTVCGFHRKLAPFKFAFAASHTTPSDQLEELRMLCRYLGLDLRKSGLPTILPSASTFGKKNINQIISFYDGLGVPYVLVVTPETLKSGIAGLRGRDTTLEEEVHVGKFVEYCEMLMKNY